MEIVAFGHRRRVGKNTAADYLFSAIKNFNPKLKVFKGGFADAVKEQAHNMFAWAGVHPSYYYENNPGTKEQIIPALGISARDVWIHIGETVRQICPTVWVELLWEKIPKDTNVVIIYDLRKIPEANYIIEHGGTCHRVLRDVPRFADPVDSELETYPAWGIDIQNDGSKEELMGQMKVFAELLMSKGRF